ncbi:MAG: hypothetical protein NWF01_03300 [Candidatus Bathyarchaeota archaeon]|nr:hypothetical protein [Candidatus Bathyarchaeota archaeon]
MYLKTKLPTKAICLTLITVLTICPLIAQAFSMQLTNTTEYNTYVHTYSTTQGNFTYIQKPIFPIQINNTQIQVGENWTIICPLQAAHNYHVYCYGSWVNTSSTAKTDYDIYVYGPQGNLESGHTEAAGLPEHLGTAPNEALFTPQQSGNYSFVIKNDARQSSDAQAATFMIMEALTCDQWHTCSVEGKTGGTSSFRTYWAYELVTNASTVELYVNVPHTLDMYEARLYLMNTAQSLSINSYPLPIEAGLYGNQTGGVGGYNFEAEGYRGVSYASCEHHGQSMFLNYTSNLNGLKLYHLVLIGEEGSGEVQFMLKTTFENTTLTPIATPKRVDPQTPTNIAYNSSTNNLESAQLTYTTNNWTGTHSLNMQVADTTCNATIPGQTAGTLVQYQISAFDVLKNSLNASGSYTVKEQPTVNITIEKDEVSYNENITVQGILSPMDKTSNVSLFFDKGSANSTIAVTCQLSSNGSFVASFQPESSGLWYVLASCPETSSAFSCQSQNLTVEVAEPPIYIKYSIPIIGGLVAAGAVGGVVYFFKFRER